jgi:hypothetical protein
MALSADIVRASSLCFLFLALTATAQQPAPFSGLLDVDLAEQ